MTANDFRQRARENLAGNWGISIAVAALAFLLGGTMTGSSFIPSIDHNIEIEFLRKLDFLMEEGIRIGNTTIGLRSGILSLMGFIVGGAVQLGYARFLLKQHDGETLDWHDLFSQFHRFGQGFSQAFLRNLYVTLWTLLFIIPGIVKSLSYSMTPYIMIEEPELSASEAIEKSMTMMDGHKWELFKLRLSFIGWNILAVGLTLNLGYLMLNPYQNAAETAFYRNLNTHHPHL